MIPNWKVYNVLLSIKGSGDKKNVKVCLPLDESETAVMNDKNEPCAKRAEFVDQERKKNDDYLQNLQSNPNFPVMRRPEVQMPVNNNINNPSKINIS